MIWDIVGIIRGFREFNPIKAEEILEKSKLSNKTEFKSYLGYRYTIVYDNKITINIEYLPNKEAHIFSNKIKVKEKDYKETLNVINEILEIIKFSLPEIKEEKYTLTIFLKKKIENVNTHLTLFKDHSIVKMWKNKIQISSNSFDCLTKDIKSLKIKEEV